MVTSPIITAAGSIHALTAICGLFPRKARMSGTLANIPRGQQPKTQGPRYLAFYLNGDCVSSKEIEFVTACYESLCAVGPALAGQLVDLYRRPRRARANFCEPCGHRARQAKKALCPCTVFACRGDRLAGITTDTNARINFNFAQKWHAIFTCGGGAIAVTKNVHGFAAVRTRKSAHIFDYAQHFHVYLAKHFNGLAHVSQCHGRRCSDNYGAGYGYGLDQR